MPQHAVRIERTHNRHSRAVLQQDTIVIRLARRLSASEEQRHIESLVRRMATMLQTDRQRTVVDAYFPLSEAQKQDTERLVHRINAATLAVPIRRIRLRPMTSQWGSCSHHGDITLNTALLKLPQHLLEYVIIHELAHRLVKNHSWKFWSVVEQAYPNYKNVRRELLSYRLRK